LSSGQICSSRCAQGESLLEGFCHVAAEQAEKIVPVATRKHASLRSFIPVARSHSSQDASQDVGTAENAIEPEDKSLVEKVTFSACIW